MFKKSLRASLAALGASVMISGCGGGGGATIDFGYQAWYDVFGYQCGYSPGPGCNFYANGWKILDVEDPYFLSSYYLTYQTFYYTNSYGVSSVYTGYGWRSPNGIVYDYYGDALNSKAGKGRDYAADVEVAEAAKLEEVSAAFADKYNLEPKIAAEVVSVLNDYAKISDRARSEADYADFSKRLAGQDVNTIKTALAEAMKGNRAELDAAYNSAASHWGLSSPETVREIVKDWFGRSKEAAAL